MNMPKGRRRKIKLVAPMLVGVLHMLICLFLLRRSVDVHETRNIFATRSSFGEIWQSVFMAPYLSLLKIWTHFFGHYEISARMLSVFSGALMVMLCWVWLNGKYGAKKATVSSVLVAIFPPVVMASITANPLALIAVFAMTAFCLIVHVPQRRHVCFWAALLIIYSAVSAYCLIRTEKTSGAELAQDIAMLDSGEGAPVYCENQTDILAIMAHLRARNALLQFEYPQSHDEEQFWLLTKSDKEYDIDGYEARMFSELNYKTASYHLTLYQRE